MTENALQVQEPGAETLEKIRTMPEKLEATGQLQAIVPRNLEEGFRIAQLVVKAGLAPDSYSNDPQKVVLGIMKGMEVGLPPLTALSGIAIINGRPSIWGDAAVALCQGKGVVEKVKVEWEGGLSSNDNEENPPLADFSDDYTCVYKVWRKGQDEPYEGRFSVRDARRAKLWANPKRQPWCLYPKRMLMNRARAFALRDGFADALSGLAIIEEIQDIPAPPKDVKTDFLDTPKLPPHEDATTNSTVAQVEGETEPSPTESEETIPDRSATFNNLYDVIISSRDMKTLEQRWALNKSALDTLDPEERKEIETFYRLRKEELG